jgi:signal transduction histidine kinase
MTLDQVRDYWMKIGTSNKTIENTTESFGRLKTGSKGVGRFACRRLGAHLQLRTTARVSVGKKSSFQTTHIGFNWNNFQPGIDVESVESLGHIETAPQGQTGTTLEIWGGATDEWQARGYEYLQRQLALLASNRGVRRDGYLPDPGFNVILDAPGYSGSPIDVRDKIIEASWGTLAARVDKEGRAVCSLTAKGVSGTKTITSSRRFSQIAGSSLRVGVLPAMKDEARRPDLLANYVLSELINEWGGIHLRLNGFRVFPYGDPHDDWLRIDADRGRRLGKPEGELFEFASKFDRIDAGRVLLNMLGMRNYIGQVEVSSKIKGLVPRIDRQGFIENAVFDEVRAFARFAIEWAVIYRDNYIRLREHEEAQKAREAIRPVLNLEGPKEHVVPKAASFLRSEIKRIVRRLPPAQQRATEQTLVKTVKAIETANTETFRQLEHLRLIASASTLTLLFAHEVRTVIGALGGASLRLSQLARSVPRYGQELGTLGAQLRETKSRFDNLVSMTGIVGAFRKSDVLTSIHLKTAIERAAQCFRLVIDNYKINVDDSSVPTDLMVGPIIEGELYTILLNLLSNSVKAVIAAGRTKRGLYTIVTQHKLW